MIRILKKTIMAKTCKKNFDKKSMYSQLKPSDKSGKTSKFQNQFFYPNQKCFAQWSKALPAATAREGLSLKKMLHRQKPQNQRITSH
jgi:hypothetical protein